MLRSPLAKDELEDGIREFDLSVARMKRIAEREIRHRINTVPGFENLIESEVIELFNGFLDDAYAGVKTWKD